MPDGQDPADVVREDPLQLKKIVGDSVHVIDFLFQALKADAKDERQVLLKTRIEICPLIVAIRDSGNRVDGDYFINFIAKEIGVSSDSIRYEVDRIENERKETPQFIDTDEHRDAHVIKQQTKRKELESHFLALYQILQIEYVWIAKEVERVLMRILGDDETIHFWRTDNGAEAGEVFRLEANLEKLSEKQIVEDVRSDLARYAEVIAKEKLHEIRKKQIEARARGDEEEELRLAGESKNAEILRIDDILIEKP